MGNSRTSDPGHGPPVFDVEEQENFQRIARAVMPSPGQLPRIRGLDIAGEALPLRGVIGGDHLIYLDFNQRFDLERRINNARREGRTNIVRRLEDNRTRVGLLLADVAGHQMTDGLVGAMLHQAFLLGVHYELERHGRVTTELFEVLNQRFFHSTGPRKYVTMLYAEVSDRGRARLIAAGHPPPFVFSAKRKTLLPVEARQMLTFPPLGMFPSYTDLSSRIESGARSYDENYTETEEVDILEPGDTLLLYTDGLSEHGTDYFPAGVEGVLASQDDTSTREACERLRNHALSHSEPADDLSFVLVKRLPDVRP